MKKFLLFTIFIFCACSSSKQYYEPKESHKLKTIKTQNEDILKNYKDYELINKIDDLYVISNNLGFLKILKDKEIVFDKKFEAKIVGFNLEGNKAVMVDALNNVTLFDLLTQEYLYSENYGQANGVIKKLANPIIDSNIIAVPTLDGKLVILNNNTNTLIRNISIGTGDFFNNVIYLKIKQDRLLAVSPTKIFTILNNDTFSKLLNIKKAIEIDNNIYILASDGTIYKYNYNLEELAKTKLKYANYSEVYFYNNFLYALEHNGYLIKFDEYLNELDVFKLGSKISKNAYFKDDVLFYNNKSYKLK